MHEQSRDRRQFIKGAAVVTGGAAGAMYIKPSLKPLGVVKAYAGSAGGPPIIPSQQPPLTQFKSPGKYKTQTLNLNNIANFPYTTSTLVNTIFTFPGTPNYAPLDTYQIGGDHTGGPTAASKMTILGAPGNSGALGSQLLIDTENLLFQAVAAILNAANYPGSYPLSTSDITGAVNYVLANPGPNDANIVTLGKTLESYHD